MGGIAAFNLLFEIAKILGIPMDEPGRNFDGFLVFLGFMSAFLVLVLCLYFSCFITSLAYFWRAFKRGNITADEYLDICFKGLYPQKWQRGL